MSARTETTTSSKHSDERYIRQSQLIPDIIPISSATLWRWVKSGRFPAPVKLGPGVTAWEMRRVAEFLANRAAE